MDAANNGSFSGFLRSEAFVIRHGEAPPRRRSIAFVLSCLGSVQLFQVTCICFESLTFRAQRPERRGEVLWQLCLQQEEECAGVGDPSGLHIIWNPEICGEPLRCRGENERARVCVQVERKKKEENNHLNLFLEIRRMTNLELFFSPSCQKAVNGCIHLVFLFCLTENHIFLSGSFFSLRVPSR